MAPLKIVEAYDREILGNAQAQLPGGSEGGKGQAIGDRENGCRLQALDCLCKPLSYLLERTAATLQQKRGIHYQTPLLQGSLIPLEAFLDIGKA